MSIINIDSKTDFDAKIKEGKYLIDFHASWCGPCQMLGPVLEEIADDLATDGVDIIKIDVDKAPDIAGVYGVMSIPALFVIKDGENIGSQLGFKPGEQLIEWVKSV